jgi:hypothetical protein
MIEHHTGARRTVRASSGLTVKADLARLARA